MPSAFAWAALACLLVLIAVLIVIARRRQSMQSEKQVAASLVWQPNGITGFLPLNVSPPQPMLWQAEALVARLASLERDHTFRSACASSLPMLHLPALLAGCENALEAELLAERACLLYAFLAYAYLREKEGTCSLPPMIAVPWHSASEYVGRAPSLDYVVTVLMNGSDAAAAIASFTDLDDERAFYALHARIERAAAPAVSAMARVDAASGTHVSTDGHAAAERQGCSLLELQRALEEVACSVQAMAALLPEMALGCRPHIFHDAIRSRLAGFTQPVRFEGVAGRPSFRLGGASGAQSAILPCVDAFLGISHNGRNELRQWSVDEGNLSHLPPPHRALLRRLRASAPASAAAIRATLAKQPSCDGSPAAEAQAAVGVRALYAAHTACIDALSAFRKAHFALVRRYIMMPHAKAERDGEESGRGSPASVTAALVGTGGSELSGFLTGRLLDTARAALGESADRVRSSRLLA